MVLRTFAPGIWIKEYPVRYAGCQFYGRMTVIQLSQSNNILIHSPCEIDDETKTEIEGIGSVTYIIAPGTYHHFYIQSAQKAFPSARTYICPGLEKKRPDISYQDVLTDEPPKDTEGSWGKDLKQVILHGNRIIWEVAFFHQPSSTLILVDLIENIGDHTPGTNWVLRFWWKYILLKWNKVTFAPEYQMGWKLDKSEARRSLTSILEWNFDKVIISHGENITSNAKDLVKEAWSGILG